MHQHRGPDPRPTREYQLGRDLVKALDQVHFVVHCSARHDAQPARFLSLFFRSHSPSAPTSQGATMTARKTTPAKATPAKATPAKKAAPARKAAAGIAPVRGNATPAKVARPAANRAPAAAYSAPPAPPAVSVRLDDLAEQIAELRKLEVRRKALQAKEARHIAAIKEAMGDAVEGTVGGIPVVRWATTARVGVSAPMVREKFPDVAAACEKVTTVRTFQIIPQA